MTNHENPPLQGTRIADDPIYLNENRYDNPKEMFKVLGKYITEAQFPSGAALLDVGCATGEFLYYSKKILPTFAKFAGLDPSPDMIKHAKTHVSGVDFFVGSAVDDSIFSKREYNVVTCIGVMSIFDDFESPLRNLLSCVKENGLILITGPFNDDPIDIITRYRRADSPQKGWELGWNIFSKNSIEKMLQKSGYQLRWVWRPFRLPFALKKRPHDPMRTWTISANENPHQLVNGACQLLNMQTLSIQVLKASV